MMRKYKLGGAWLGAPDCGHDLNGGTDRQFVNRQWPISRARSQVAIARIPLSQDLSKC